MFCSEMPIFLREHFNGMYRVDVYYITKQLAELPFFLVTPVLFVAIFYYMVGLNPTFDRFAYACLIVTVLTQVVVSYGETKATIRRKWEWKDRAKCFQGTLFPACRRTSVSPWPSPLRRLFPQCSSVDSSSTASRRN